MSPRDLEQRAENWLVEHCLAEQEAWLREKQVFEMACPYIYPPASRYRDLDLRQVYAAAEAWEEIQPSLYVHIPYCLSRCSFCNFALDEVGTASEGVDSYLQAVEEEARAIVETAVAGRNVSLGSIYIGGGTPSILNLRQTEQLFRIIGRFFSLPPGAECSFEVNPDTVRGEKRAKWALLKEHGVNRVSLGVQSFDPETLQALRRLHTVEMVEHAMSGAREAGIESVNIDLMYSLPLMSLERWAGTLTKAVELQPDSISLYQLRIAPHSTLNELAQTRLANVRVQQAMALLYLTANGYQHSSPNQFIRHAGHRQRHYIEVRERLADVIGLGVSAISQVGRHSFRGPMTLAAYMAARRDETLPYRGVPMEIQERRTRACVLGLKSPRGISESEYGRRLGCNPLEAFPTVFRELFEHGLAERHDGCIKVTDSGSFFMDAIATLFFQRQDVEAVRGHEVEHLGVYWHD
jgi:oxygen-independent coproporphyrinogen-3 oxidase